MNLDTSKLDGRQNYKLMSGGVTPRPIAWISTRSAAGVDNLAPFSFFTVASCNPPVLLYTQINPRTGLDKDTLTNLIETGECVVNLVSSRLVEKTNQTSASLSPEESEFLFADVASCPSSMVEPLSVRDSPLRYECTLRQVLAVSDLPTGGKVVLLDVKSVYVRDDLYLDGRIDQASLDTAGKLGGDSFSVSPVLLDLPRPG